MLLDDATMQVSFVKDLVTMRDPTSDFSFLAYLHKKGRLVDFINHKILYPLRVEFHDYLEWAASRVDHLVHYDARPTAYYATMPTPSGVPCRSCSPSPCTGRKGRVFSWHSGSASAAAPSR
jgi:L-ornithine N5-oxygenase